VAETSVAVEAAERGSYRWRSDATARVSNSSPSTPWRGALRAGRIELAHLRPVRVTLSWDCSCVATPAAHDESSHAMPIVGG